MFIESRHRAVDVSDHYPQIATMKPVTTETLARGETSLSSALLGVSSFVMPALSFAPDQGRPCRMLPVSPD